MSKRFHLIYATLCSSLLLSSCLLLVALANEEAQLHQQQPKGLLQETNDVEANADAEKSTSSRLHTQEIKETMPTEGGEDKSEFIKVLPNYKKIRKLKQEREAIAADVNAKEIVSQAATAEASAPVTLSTSIREENSNSDENKFFIVTKEEHKRADFSAAGSSANGQAVSDEDSSKASSENGLPDVHDIPIVTVKELPLDIGLEAAQNNLNGLIMDAASKELTAAAAKQQENRTAAELLENIISDNGINKEPVAKDDQIIKFNDSGGMKQPILEINIASVPQQQPPAQQQNEENIPDENATTTKATSAMPTGDSTDRIVSNEASINLTSGPEDQFQQQQGSGLQPPLQPHSEEQQQKDEVPIQVFSEWAQKQMEAAEKQLQAMEQQQIVNNSSQKKKEIPNGNGKVFGARKVRSKNYASPDCGAKIIAANADASNTGAVLSSSSDEYMLSQCGNRIWFVVELCEAIQAQTVDLANFELFSSSPKNFTVAVANRFPTRDWSNVGRFVAEDKRTVQSFELHPHLFGKFVRVDIHSHYNKEHFCPVSLFRVFGTSEFEALDTENHLHDDLDDFDDELEHAAQNAKQNNDNIFKSASNAMFSIVKKAVEVVVKPVASLNQTLLSQTQQKGCRTPVFGQFSCAECNATLVERINEVLSCEFHLLQRLLQNKRLVEDLRHTRICDKQYGIELKPIESGDTENCSHATLYDTPSKMDIKKSYYLNLLPREYAGAMCQLLAEQHVQRLHNITKTTGTKKNNQDVPLNLTIDKEAEEQVYKSLDEKAPKKIISPQATTIEPTGAVEVKQSPEGSGENSSKEKLEVPQTTEPSVPAASIEAQLTRPPSEAEGSGENDSSITVSSSTTTTMAPGSGEEPNTGEVNIFNVPEIDQPIREGEQSGETSEPQEATVTPAPIPSSSEASIEPNSVEDSTTTPIVPLASATEEFTGSTTPTPPRSDEETTGSWENMDFSSTMATQQQQRLNGGGGANGGPGSESVIIRLSNRIKALERNMSLSGQYLEELSRRYKKQVEELQQTLTQQSQTVRTLEEQNLRHTELEKMLLERNAKLMKDLEDLTMQVHACIVVIIFVGGVILLMVVIGFIIHRGSRGNDKGKSESKSNNIKRSNASAVKLQRRKSYDDLADHQTAATAYSQSPEKLRRPSEEVMRILKECTSASDSEAPTEIVGDNQMNAGGGAVGRQRKISICHGGSKQNQKHSWPATREQVKQQQQYWLANSGRGNSTCEDYNSFDECDEQQQQQIVVKNHIASTTGLSAGANTLKSRKKSRDRQQQIQHLRRQESAPGELPAEHSLRLNYTAPGHLNYDESLCLEEDDLDNFIPQSDMVYNEFMPEGPSGYQILQDDKANSKAAPAAISESAQKNKKKKSGRLSSAVLFKNSFKKSKTDNSLSSSTNSSKSNPAHESTSWEWRGNSKKQQQRQQQERSQNSASHLGFTSAKQPSHSAALSNMSLDSSSLSEVNFKGDLVNSSSRILREAILRTAAEETMPLNGKENNHFIIEDIGSTASTDTGVSTPNSCKRYFVPGINRSSSSTSSNTSSNTTKKKSKKLSFKQIFRKAT